MEVDQTIMSNHEDEPDLHESQLRSENKELSK